MILLHIVGRWNQMVLLNVSPSLNRSAPLAVAQSTCKLNADAVKTLPEPMILEAKWCFLIFSVGSTAVLTRFVFF